MSVTIYSRGETLSAAEIEPWRNIPVAVAVDTARESGQIDPDIRPLRPPGQQPALFGRAVTVSCEPPDFGAMLHALEHAGPGDVLVIAAGRAREHAMIGEILCGHFRRRGVVGVVCDGAVRDVATLASWSDFSVFSRYVTPRGPMSAERGAVNVPIVVGGRLVNPGDLILGDDDGLVALSPEAVHGDLSAAQAKVAMEAQWIAGLKQGRTAAEIFGLAAPVLRDLA